MKNIELTIGGISKECLLQILKANNIQINILGERLLTNHLFQVTNEKQNIELTEISPTELGFKKEPNLRNLIDQAKKLGLQLCPVDVAPFLRLEYFQEDSHGMDKKYKTPDGAVTVVSEMIDEDNHDFPKGFYLRKIDGQEWLRGYICDDTHTFGLDETFIFLGKI